MTRAHNFCAGPCTLPVSVLSELGDEMVEYGDTGMSVIEMSHRSEAYEAIHYETLDLLRSLYAVPDDVDILLLQGGASLQFAMIPMNLLGPDGPGAGHVVGGSWGRKALGDAATVGPTYTAWHGEASGYTRMPASDEVQVAEGTDYLHVTSNETIEGVRMIDFAGFGVPLVADMSSDYLSRPIDWDLFDVVYGGAQKNLGPAGLAVTFIRKSRIAEPSSPLPTYLRFDAHAKASSLANTPPVFSIWAMGKMLRWMHAQGGVAAMERRAADRAGMIYRTIDNSEGFYRNPVDVAHRSHTNIVFRLATPELEDEFLTLAEREGLLNLKGHRSVGGIRASVYNGLPTESVETLVAFMTHFAQQEG